MPELFGYSFFQRALIAGFMAGGLCGIFSVYIIIKRMAFIGQGISHAAFGGIALGLLLGISPNIPASLFAVGMALGISYLPARGGTRRDAIIGILLSFSMALGVIFLSLSSGYTGSVMSYLFGNILSVTYIDLLWLAVITVVSIFYFIIFYKELKFFSVDEGMAEIYGIPVKPIQTGLLVCIALVVIATLQVVGIILVTALLIVPGAVAMHLCRSYRSLFIVSISIGLIAVIAGLFLSYFLNIPSGATIVVVLTGLFFISRIVRRRK